MHDNLEYYSTSLLKKAVTLVTHGLNMKPEGMLAIVQWLNEQGADVYLVKLSGHFEHHITIKDITATLWEEEMFHVYTIAKEASRQHAVPLFFVGYSLGALLGQILISSSGKDSTFDKQVLIAPATAVRSRSSFIKWLLFLNKKIVLPSFTPSPYRANKFLPLTAFEVLFRNIEIIVVTQFHKLNIPTLIFIDPKDELVSYKKLADYVVRFKLTNHEIVVLDSNLKVRESLYHHLIVSEGTMGKQNWEMATARMAAFLFGAR